MKIDYRHACNYRHGGPHDPKLISDMHGIGPTRCTIGQKLNNRHGSFIKYTVAIGLGQS